MVALSEEALQAWAAVFDEMLPRLERQTIPEDEERSDEPLPKKKPAKKATKKTTKKRGKK